MDRRRPTVRPPTSRSRTSTVAENAANGTVVGALSTTDPDAGETFTYTLLDNAGGRFALSGANVVVANGSLLNFEAGTSHNVQVRVTDSAGNTFTKTIAVGVSNVNEAPTNVALATSSVAENAANGTVVGALSTTDPDAGESFTYTLLDNAGGRFALSVPTSSSPTAASSTSRPRTSHNVQVRVTDSAGQHLHQDHRGRRRQRQRGADQCRRLERHDCRECRQRHRRRCPLGDRPRCGRELHLHPARQRRRALCAQSARTSWSPTAASSTSRPRPATMSRSGSPTPAGNSFTKTITVGVANVNEAPTNLALANATIAENVANGAIVGALSATDPDAGESFTYTLLDNAGGRFAINGSNIVVANGSLLNFEAATSHNVQVRVTDSGGNSYTKTVTIGVSNVNEAPTNVAVSNATIAENAANGAVVGSLSATDPDAGETFTYTLTDTAGGRFAVNGSNIVVANGSLLNFEAATSHNVQVKVTDSGGNSYYKTIAIGVSNVNEAPTDVAISSAAVAENAATGTIIGALSASDPDAGESFTYTLLDNAGGRFGLDGANLVVANGSLIDYETATSHNVQVRVTDSGGNSYTKTITIGVDNVSEGSGNAAPTDILITKTTITENVGNGIAVGILSATDADAGETFTYAMVNDAGGRFAIDGNKLVVANGSLLNFEAKPTHDVQVKVTDSAGNSFTKTITVELKDVNETPYNLTISKTTITENVANGTAVGVLSATDPDAGDTQTYTLLDNAGGRFAIDGNKLVVANGSLLNFEAKATHDVQVRVTDAGGKSSVKTFTIQLQNVNETPYNLSISKTTITEHVGNGIAVGVLSVDRPRRRRHAYLHAPRQCRRPLCDQWQQAGRRQWQPPRLREADNPRRQSSA